MTSLPASQVPVVPNLVMPEPAQTIATAIIAVVALIAVAAAIRYGARDRTPLYVLTLLGGVIASLNEPIADLIGGCVHPQTGSWAVFTAFDRPVPAWAVIAYGLFFGGVPLLVLALMRKAANPRLRLLQSTAVIFAANLLIEVPILSGDVYTYYGDQPFKIFGLFPLHWLTINGVGVATIAVVLYRFADRITGMKLLWFLVIPATAQVLGLSAGLPVFTLYNTNVSSPIKWAASVITMVLGVAALRALSQLVPSRPHLTDNAHGYSRPLAETGQT
ncbi:MAG TPA: hypothetical protein VIQ30_26960 [Pseudonocardia sp.]